MVCNWCSKRTRLAIVVGPAPTLRIVQFQTNRSLPSAAAQGATDLSSEPRVIDCDRGGGWRPRYRRQHDRTQWDNREAAERSDHPDAMRKLPILFSDVAGRMGKRLVPATDRPAFHFLRAAIGCSMRTGRTKLSAAYSVGNSPISACSITEATVHEIASRGE